MIWRILISLAVASVFAGLAALGWLSGWSNSQGPLKESVQVEIPSGTSLTQVAMLLEQRSIIEYPKVWGLLVRLKEKGSLLKAGEYEFSPGDSPIQVMDRLVSGVVVQHRLQLVEGWTTAQALAAIKARPELTHKLPEQVDAANLLGVLGMGEGSAEGRLFPDTYQFVRGTSDSQLIKRAIEKMDRVLEDAFSDRDAQLPYNSSAEVLIVASLIEKETGRPEDRPQISQVFARRLKLGMRLQTDPSIIYGLGTTFDGNLTRQHLRTDNPYNTYTRSGLPPTPIALPGQAALHAAVHPASGDYLYFVARGDGSSQFSRTLAEHDAAVRRYQLAPNGITP